MLERLQVLRIDDLPLLYAQIKEMGIQRIIDETILTHGNWTGISLGHLIGLWLCYLLSESDHRLSTVEGWAEENILLLGSLSGQYEIRSKDFTDDRLEQALDYVSKEANWLKINSKLNQSSLAVYDLDEQKTIRLDAAPMQGHHEVKPSGLFQFGYSKHHDSRLGMLKVMLACVDNELNGFSYPLAHMSVSGEKADDGLYIPLIADCEKTFEFNAYTGSKLYVGDSKMGSKENRYYIVNTGNDYLVPLSKRQLDLEQRNKAINQAHSADYKKVYKQDKSGKKVLVAQGFEQQTKVNYVDKEGKERQWSERQVFVLSTTYSLAQKKGLENKLTQGQQELQDLVVRKQGKKTPQTSIELQQAIDKVLNNKGLNKLLNVEIKEQVYTKEVRAYKDRPARIEQHSTFELTIRRNEQAIEAHKTTLGWQVYGTTAQEEKLDFEKCVWKYRYQNRVESRFDDLRNKVVPLVPIFVKQDNRVEALINLLMICLKICAVIEYKVAKSLQENQEELANIYEGNPKRSTPRPTAKRLLRSFKGISLALFTSNSQVVPDIRITDLKQVQLKIIELLGFHQIIYEELVDKIQLFFLNKKISET